MLVAKVTQRTARGKFALACPKNSIACCQFSTCQPPAPARRRRVRAGSGGRGQHLNIAKLGTLSIDSDHPDLSGDLTDLLISWNLSRAPFNEKFWLMGFRNGILRHRRALLARSTLKLQQVARTVVGNLRTVF